MDKASEDARVHVGKGMNFTPFERAHVSHTQAQVQEQVLEYNNKLHAVAVGDAPAGEAAPFGYFGVTISGTAGTSSVGPLGQPISGVVRQANMSDVEME
jgi:hypothetical protein